MGGVSSRNKPAMSKRSRAGVRSVSETAAGLGFPDLSARCLPCVLPTRALPVAPEVVDFGRNGQLTPVFGQYVATRPTETSKAAVRYVRFTSTPIVGGAQTPVIRRRINSGSGHGCATAQPPALAGRDFDAACAYLARRSHDPARRMRDPPACRPDRRAAMHQGVQRRRHPPGDQRAVQSWMTCHLADRGNYPDLSRGH
jgi:hypothetical protein